MERGESIVPWWESDKRGKHLRDACIATGTQDGELSRQLQEVVARADSYQNAKSNVIMTLINAGWTELKIIDFFADAEWDALNPGG